MPCILLKLLQRRCGVNLFQNMQGFLRYALVAKLPCILCITTPLEVHSFGECNSILQKLPGHPKKLWRKCCNPIFYEGFGSESCFTAEGRQGWEARRCCSALAPKNLTTNLFTHLFFGDAITYSRNSPLFNFSSFIVVPYHKSGATLSYALVSDRKMRRFLLGNQSKTQGWVKHMSTSAAGTFQNGYHQWTGLSKKILYWLGPNELGDSQVLRHFLVTGVGRIVHMVRRPSDLIVSAYFYHKMTNETWCRGDNPPNCENCDHAAWKEIFIRCNFKCSYHRLLQKSSIEHGIEIEALRSRWDVHKMLYNMKLWQGRNDVLPLSVSHFSHDFDATLRCLLFFWLNRQPTSSFLGPTDPLLTAARTRGKGADQKSKKHRTSSQRIIQAKQHLKMLSQQPDYQFITYADSLFEELMMKGEHLARSFGCPVFTRWNVTVQYILDYTFYTNTEMLGDGVVRGPVFYRFMACCRWLIVVSDQLYWSNCSTPAWKWTEGV